MTTVHAKRLIGVKRRHGEGVRMEEHVLQAVGKVAGIGGLAFGVFLLLFREVIRKNIFPTLSDDEAYRLIKQFMYLTFGIALVGIASWTYITVTTATLNTATVHGGMVSAVKSLEPSPDISGVWTGDVKYSWGDTHAETFTFEANEHAISGVASYVTGRNAISEGIIEGNRLSFQTHSYSDMDGKRYQEKHWYRGTVSGDVIQFVLETDSGYNATPPINFTAHKKTSK